MRHLSVSVLVLHLTVCFTERPIFITPEEFAAVQGQEIEIGNASLVLPKYEIGNNIYPRPGFGPRLWTNAEVPYTLDSNFDKQQRHQIALAINAYHESTCLRFIPKNDQHSSWVDIQLDNSVCGSSILCMNSGGQFSKFGGSCVSAGTMVHELGHTLCMSHEQSRLDRDAWIDFDTNVCEVPPKDGSDFKRGLNKMYDYVSIEHYEGECYNGCYKPKQPGVTKCGSGGRLSVLDIEILNEMYGCNSGCQGYRYVNINNDWKSPVEAGNEPNDDILYSCRAYHSGDIIPGKYHGGRGECYVAYNGNEHVKTKGSDSIEVLTNPNGANFQWQSSDSLPDNAVRGGRSSERETLYVIRCKLNVNGKNIWCPGKFQPSVGPYTSFSGKEIKCENFEFLVCN